MNGYRVDPGVLFCSVGTAEICRSLQERFGLSEEVAQSLLYRFGVCGNDSDDFESPIEVTAGVSVSLGDFRDAIGSLFGENEERECLAEAILLCLAKVFFFCRHLV